MQELTMNEVALVSGAMFPRFSEIAGGLAGGAFADWAGAAGFGFGGFGGAIIGFAVAGSIGYDSSNAWAGQAVSDAYTSGASI